MIEIHFIDLIKYKRFGTIEIGDSKQTIITSLGQPDGVLNPALKPPAGSDVFYYGDFLFHCKDDSLYSISNTHIQDVFTWKFNPAFHYRNQHFRFTSWFSKPSIDTRLRNVKKKLESEGISYREAPFYDSMQLTLGDSISLDFSSKHSYHKDYEQWAEHTPNLRLCHFCLSTPRK